MVLRISMYESPQLQATVLTMRGLDRELAKNIRAVTKNEIAPTWKQAVAEQIGGPRVALEGAVLSNTARVTVGDSNVILKAGGLGKRLSGGGTISQLTAGTEFGSDYYHQFGPKRKAGPVYSAAAKEIPHIASIWVKTVFRTFFDLLPDLPNGKAV